MSEKEIDERVREPKYSPYWFPLFCCILLSVLAFLHLPVPIYSVIWCIGISSIIVLFLIDLHNRTLYHEAKFRKCRYHHTPMVDPVELGFDWEEDEVFLCETEDCDHFIWNPKIQQPDYFEPFQYLREMFK